MKEIKHNDLMTEKHKTTCKHLIYVEQLVNLASSVTGSLSISAFTLLVCVSVGISSSAEEIKLRPFTTRIKKYRPIINKRRKKHDKK